MEGVPSSEKTGRWTAKPIGVGASKSALWRQIVADILGIDNLLPRTTDASFGAALLAGVGVGIFADPLAAARHCTQVLETARPDPARAAYYSELFDFYKAAQRGLQDVNHGLSRLREAPAGGA